MCDCAVICALYCPPPPRPSGASGRIDQIERTVRTLVGQSLAADEVVISIPQNSAREGMAYTVPAWLEALVGYT